MTTPTPKDDEEEMTICDRRACEVAVAESQNGPDGTEWEGSNLCNECYAEIAP